MTMRRLRRSHGLSPRTWVALVLVAGLLALGAVLPAGANQHREKKSARRPPSDEAKGLVYDRLEVKERGPCRNGFRVRVGDGSVVCTPGPDPAPRVIDVTEARDTGSLSTTASDTGSVPCIGDGVSGQRVQALYAVAADTPDRYASVAPLISGWGASMDSALNASAAETGGERHIRFVTNSDCTLNVAHAVLSPAGDDTFAATISELRALGYARTDRKYLVWADARVYCGIAQMTGSDQSGATNPSNSGPHYARVDTGCWGRSDHLSELHELLHTLGAVQTSAPHATAGFHCTDEYDAICYPDASNVKMTYVCPSAHEWLLDCNHDDYFSTAPPPGSYLATHWNVADSAFLTGSLGPTPPPSPSPSPSVSPSPSPSPSSAPGVATATFSGSISNKHPSKVFRLDVGTGDSVNALEYGTTGKGKNRVASPLRLRILTSAGTVVGDVTGPSVVRLTQVLPAGTYTWEISGTGQASFSLLVTYPVP